MREGGLIPDLLPGTRPGRTPCPDLSLNSIKGGYIGDSVGDYSRGQ